ncbi:hypothetical protein WJX84_003307 [Apatococcus fuscideae]|uniref:Large ribosomal subunit protein mL43 n=1 Tax=Apatococcus fuscideae TaxID=2026836 RepID=A0AAW1T876_9CHLO
MSRRGVWQLKHLTLRYCDWSGSSKGTRDFIDHLLPQFSRENAQLKIETAVQRGRHPSWHAQYRWGI